MHREYSMRTKIERQIAAKPHMIAPPDAVEPPDTVDEPVVTLDTETAFGMRSSPRVTQWLVDEVKRLSKLLER